MIIDHKGKMQDMCMVHMRQHVPPLPCTARFWKVLRATEATPFVAKQV